MQTNDYPEPSAPGIPAGPPVIDWDRAGNDPLYRRLFRKEIEEIEREQKAIADKTIQSAGVFGLITPYAVNITDRAKYLSEHHKRYFLESSVRLAGALTSVLGMDLIREIGNMEPDDIRKAVINAVSRHADPTAVTSVTPEAVVT